MPPDSAHAAYRPARQRRGCKPERDPWDREGSAYRSAVDSPLKQRRTQVSEGLREVRDQLIAWQPRKSWTWACSAGLIPEAVRSSHAPAPDESYTDCEAHEGQ